MIQQVKYIDLKPAVAQEAARRPIAGGDQPAELEPSSEAKYFIGNDGIIYSHALITKMNYYFSNGQLVLYDAMDAADILIGAATTRNVSSFGTGSSVPARIAGQRKLAVVVMAYPLPGLNGTA